MFPHQAISTSTVISGNTSHVLLSTTSPVIVLGARMQQSGVASETIVQCGNGVVAYNYAKDYPLDLMNMYCTGGITVQKTGNDQSFVNVTYLPYWATNTPSLTSSLTATPTAMIANGFTYGEIWIGTLLLLLLLGNFFGGIIAHTVGLKRRERNTRNPQK